MSATHVLDLDRSPVMSNPNSIDLLVVEDDLDMLETLAMLLGNAGYSVRLAHNGREALEEVAARRPDLVLMDMLMPGMSGWECSRELRERYGDAIPIVAVTAAEHGRARAEMAGADDVISKPFDVEALLATVAWYVGRATPSGP